jgi:hypothetical protein
MALSDAIRFRFVLSEDEIHFSRGEICSTDAWSNPSVSENNSKFTKQMQVIYEYLLVF